MDENLPPIIRCTLCKTEHNRLWTDGSPSMFCLICQKLKNKYEGTYQSIIGSVYLGDYEAADDFDGDRLCVHEDERYVKHLHSPILVKKPRGPLDRSGALADAGLLDVATSLIWEKYATHKRVLVHCKGGMERSPLTLAWFLNRYGLAESLEDAYVLLKSKRPIVAPRLEWLPK